MPVATENNEKNTENLVILNALPELLNLDNTWDRNCDFDSLSSQHASVSWGDLSQDFLGNLTSDIGQTKTTTSVLVALPIVIKPKQMQQDSM